MTSSVRNAGVVLVAVVLLVWAGAAGHGRQAEDRSLASAGSAPVLKLPPVPAQKLSNGSWHPAPAGPGEVVYEGVGFRTRPPRAGVHPKVSRDEALVLTGMTGPGSGRPAVLELRDLVTRDFDDETPKRAGLAWVATFQNVPEPSYGGKVNGPLPPTADPPPPTTSCTSTVIVSATTGREAGRFSSCGPDQSR